MDAHRPDSIQMAYDAAIVAAFDVAVANRLLDKSNWPDLLDMHIRAIMDVYTHLVTPKR